MRRYLLPLLAVCLSTAVPLLSQSSQSPSSSSIPAKSKNGAESAQTNPADITALPKPKESKPDYSKEAFVVEQSRSTSRFESDGTGRRETIARIRVQSEAGVQQWGQLQGGYNSANERVEIPYVRVLKEDGSVVKAGDDAVQDLSAPVEHDAPVYTDYRQKHITVPGLRPGEILEYDLVTVVHTALAPDQFWTEYTFDHTNIVLNEEFAIDVPASRAAKLKTKPGMDPKISEENGRRIYRWIGSHIDREDHDSDKSKDRDKDKNKKAKPDDDRPDIQLTTFANWE